MEREQELERRIEQLEERLASTERELESFLYAISHDLRGPLRTIMSSSMILIEDYGESLDSTAREEIDRQARAAKKIASLIDDVLKLSRLGRQEMNVCELNLSSIAEDVAGQVAARAKVAPQIDVQPGMRVAGDANLVRTLLASLLDNAVKFAKPGQPAVVHMGQEDGAFFVRDEGIGFSPEQAERIFRPFERLHAEGEYPGSGIGLFAVRMVAQKHHGKAWGEGREGAGATFWFTLEARVTDSSRA